MMRLPSLFSVHNWEKNMTDFRFNPFPVAGVWYNIHPFLYRDLISKVLADFPVTRVKVNNRSILFEAFKQKYLTTQGPGKTVTLVNPELHWLVPRD
jgi:hypothetical protein